MGGQEVGEPQGQRLGGRNVTLDELGSVGT